MYFNMKKEVHDSSFQEHNTSNVLGYIYHIHQSRINIDSPGQPGVQNPQFPVL